MLTSRRHRSATAALTLALLTLGRTARADTAIPFVARMSESAVLLFILIVPLEAFVLHRVLRVFFKKALLESLLANAVTTLLGVGLAFTSIILRFDLVGFAWFLLLFALSVFLEGWVVQRRLRVEPQRGYAASAIMNTLSYALLAVAALILSDAHSTARARRRDGAMMLDSACSTPIPVFVGGGMHDAAHP